MKPFLVSLWSMGTICLVSIEHIDLWISIPIQTTIGVLTIIYLIKKIRSIKIN